MALSLCIQNTMTLTGTSTNSQLLTSMWNQQHPGTLLGPIILDLDLDLDFYVAGTTPDFKMRRTDLFQAQDSVHVPFCDSCL